ncbi:MAG: PH domain-containing protein [Planctomycetota bacterium]|jgi:putative membrane protein
MQCEGEGYGALPRQSYPLHGASLIFQLIALVRSFVIPLIVVIAARDLMQALLLLPLGLFFVGGLLRAFAFFATFRFGLHEGELFTEVGLFRRQQRAIAVSRVHDVRLEQTILSRLLGVVRVEVETAGGTEPEFTLPALGQGEAHALRDAILGARYQAAAAALSDGVSPSEVGAAQLAAPPTETVLREVGPDELLAAGFTSGRAGLVLAMAAVALGFLADIVPGLELRVEGVVRWAAARFEEDPLRGLGYAAAGAASVVVLSVLLSAIGTFVVFYGFRLTLVGDDLRRRYGLLTRRIASLPRRRIQTLLVEEGMLRRLFGLMALRAVSAGSLANRVDASSGRDVLLPVAGREDLHGLLGQILPGVEPDPDWRMVSPRAVGRSFRRGLFALAVLGFVAFRLELGRPAALALIALIPLIYVRARLRYRTLGYAVGRDHLWIRRGVLSKKTYLVPIAKIQGALVTQNPFDRRLGLARLLVDTAGQPVLDRPVLTDLEVGRARGLAAELSRRAQRKRFRW